MSRCANENCERMELLKNGNANKAFHFQKLGILIKTKCNRKFAENELDENGNPRYVRNVPIENRSGCFGRARIGTFLTWGRRSYWDISDIDADGDAAHGGMSDLSQ